MCQRHPSLHPKHLRIQWTQANGMREMLNRGVCLTVESAQETTKEPGGGEVRIEQHGPVEQCDTPIEVAGEMTECMASSRERHGIVPAELHCQPCQAGALGDLSGPIGHPAIHLAPEIAPGPHA